MFIYATDLPKDIEKPLLQVMTAAEPPHIIHFLYFNLVVPLGKLFWSLHPAVKHGHYSILSPDLTKKKKKKILRKFWKLQFFRGGGGRDDFIKSWKKWGKDLLILGANVTFIQNSRCQFFPERGWGEIRAAAHWKHPLWSTVVLD